MIACNQLILVPPGIANFKPGVHRVVVAARREKCVALFWMGEITSEHTIKPGTHCNRPAFFQWETVAREIEKGLLRSIPEDTVDAPPNRYRAKAVQSPRFERNRQILTNLVNPDQLFSMVCCNQWHARISEAAVKHRVNAITIKRLLNRFFLLRMDLDWACEDRYWVKGSQRNITTKLGRPAKRHQTGHNTSSEGRNASEEDKRAIEIFYNSLESQSVSMASMYRGFEENFAPKKAIVREDGSLDLVADATQACISQRQFRYWLSMVKGELTLLKDAAGQRRLNLLHRVAVGSARDRVPYPGHTFIIDATVGDVYLVSAFDRRRLIGRPVIYLVVDAFSSLIVSLHVALEGPNFQQARIAMCRAISPKNLWLKWLGLEDLIHLFPQGCVPAFWLADRGEVHSVDSRAMQTALRTNLSIAAAYRAEWKALVERAFGILNTMLIHWMPGAVVRRQRERGEPDTRLDATLTLKEFTRVLARKVAILNLTRNMSKHLSASLVRADVRPNPLGFYTHGIDYMHGSAVFLDNQNAMRKTLESLDAKLDRRGIFAGSTQYTAPWMLDHPAVQLAGFSGARPVKLIESPDDPMSAWCLLPEENTMREVQLARRIQRTSSFSREDFLEMDALSTFRGQDMKDETTPERLALQRANKEDINEAKITTRSVNREAPLSKSSKLKGIRINRQQEVAGTAPQAPPASAWKPSMPETQACTPALELTDTCTGEDLRQNYFERMSAQMSGWQKP